MSIYYEPLIGINERKWLIKLSKWVVALGALFFIYNAAIKNVDWSLHSTADTVITAPVALLNPQMTVYADQLGIDKNLLIVTQPSFGDANAACQTKAVELTGCEDLNTHKITLTQHGAIEDRAALAYEYLHYIWEVKLDEPGRQMYEPYLMQLYNANPTLRQALAPLNYEGGIGSSAWYDELHSMAGTYTSDNELTPILLNHFKQYLPNRSALPSVF